MKKLILVRTPYQLIVALYIKEQFCKKGDIVDLIVTETFNNNKIIVDRLTNLRIFNSINKKNKIKKLYYLLTFKPMIENIFGSMNVYDEFYFWNYDSMIINLISYLFYKNNNLKVFIFEEGYISYFPLNEIFPERGMHKLMNVRNKLLGIKKINFNSIDGYLFFNPKLSIFDTKIKKYEISRKSVNDKKMNENIKYIFDVKESTIKNYDKKIIIFEETALTENNFDDINIILKIAEKVGKDNVLIKLHPRTKGDRFSKLGIKTLGSDGIPWEAITLTGDFSNKILIAIGSGSIVNYRLTYGKNMRAILLFKLFKTNLKYLSSNYDKFWNKLKSTYPESGIYMPETMEELDKILDDIRSDENENSRNYTS